MKTDKFEENIRQKLEGIDPPFHESDWSQLRSVLRRNGVPSIGGTVTQWLVPMMSAAAVAGLLILTVWQYRTNQKLEQTVRTLKDTVTILQQTPMAELPKADTVYITREIPAPRLSPSAPTDRTDSDDRGLAERSESEQSETDQPETNHKRTVAPTELSQLQKPEGNRPEGTVLSERTESKERLTELKEGLAESKERLAEPKEGLTKSNQPTTGRKFSDRPERNTAPSTNASKSTGDRWNRTDERRYSGKQKPGGFEITRPLSSGVSDRNNQSGNGNFETVAGASESDLLSWKPVLSRPLQFDSSYYTEKFQRRIRRIRPSIPVAIALAASVMKPEKPEVEKSQWLVHFRIGGSAQIGGGGQSGLGLASELLIGPHFTLGVGLNKLKISGEQFLSDVQYNIKKRSDFRRDYPGKVPTDMRIEIMDIGRSGTTWQLPISIGYRLPLGNSFAIIPLLGASFSLEAREQISYTHRMGPYDFKQTKFNEECKPNVYNSSFFSIGVEKQWSHWVIQASPYLSSPLVSTQLSLNQTSAGVRTRILYQF